MAAFQKESGAAKGRGFGTVDGIPSFFNRLATWIVKAPVAGGPGWYIIDDQRTALANPYIVISDVAVPTNANKGKIIQCILPSDTGDVVLFRFWEWWNVSTHVGTHNYSQFGMDTRENQEYEYNFRGGPDCLLLMTRIGSDWDWVLLESWTRLPIFCEDPALEGALVSDYTTVYNDGGNQVGEFWRLNGIGPHLDLTNGRLYISVVVSGANSQIFIYKDAARTQLIGQTTNSNFIGTVNVTAQNSSGVSGDIRRNAVTATDTDIEVDFSLNLGAGEGASFTVGKFYYMWDFVNGSRAAYVKVRAMNGDSLVVESINNTQFSAGTRISPYGHRWFVWGSSQKSVTGFSAFGGNAQLPYFSAINQSPSNRCLSDGVNISPTTGMGLDAMSVLVHLDPDDEGRYVAMRPLVRENVDRAGQSSGPSSHANRAYGRSDNVYVSSNTGLSQMLDGRVIAGVDYIMFHSSGEFSYLIRDTTSLS